MKPVSPAAILLSTMLVLGCGGSDGGDPGAGGDGGDPPMSAADAGANQGTDGGAAATQCRRVDLVFSVDPSGSMKEERDEMADVVFPSFADALIQVGGGLDDYRVGVIDSCPDPATFNTQNSNGDDCNFSSGESWMVSASPDLVGEFSCVGDLDRDNNCSGDNDDEQPASAAAASLEGANDGFLRDDALLVVIAITDEDETPTGEAKSAQEVYDRLVAIKGDVKKMVFLGIGGASDCDGVYGHAEEAGKLISITDKFIAEDRGVFVDLCEGDLEQGLLDAMSVINQACSEFPSPE